MLRKVSRADDGAWSFLGVRAADGGDERVHAAHRAAPVYLEAQAVQLHLRQPTGGKSTIWHEGPCLGCTVLRVRKSADGGLDYVHLHPDLVHR